MLSSLLTSVRVTLACRLPYFPTCVLLGAYSSLHVLFLCACYWYVVRLVTRSFRHVALCFYVVCSVMFFVRLVSAALLFMSVLPACWLWCISVYAASILCVLHSSLRWHMSRFLSLFLMCCFGQFDRRVSVVCVSLCSYCSHFVMFVYIWPLPGWFFWLSVSAFHWWALSSRAVFPLF